MFEMTHEKQQELVDAAAKMHHELVFLKEASNNRSATILRLEARVFELETRVVEETAAHEEALVDRDRQISDLQALLKEREAVVALQKGEIDNLLRVSSLPQEDP